MPRSVFPDYAIFHVTTRGAGQIPIYREDDDRRSFLVLLGDAVQRYGLLCHAFCLMTNHYHLVVEGFRDKLSSGQQRLNGAYAQGFNGKYKRWGHLFGERFWCGRSTRKISRPPACTSWQIPSAPVCASA